MTDKRNITIVRNLLRLVILIVSALLIHGALHAQSQKSEILTIYGILMSSDSTQPVADAQIFSRDNYLGSFSDSSGRFFITVTPDDSLMFSSLGYMNKIVPVTDSLLRLKQPLVFYMSLDTILIHEVIIHGYWDYETFKQKLIDMIPAKSSYDVTDDMKKRPLLYKQRQGYIDLFSPIQTLYDLFNKKAVIQRRLLHDRRAYNRRMIKLGRPQDTIPSKLDYMIEKIRQ